MAQQVRDSRIFNGIRLPKTFRPLHYKLHLTPDFENFTFTGQVQIDYDNGLDEGHIIVHAAELEILEGNLNLADGDETHKLKTVYYNTDNETASLEFESGPFPSGCINLSFKGTLNDKMVGFYRTSFKMGQNIVWGAATQFSAIDARRCFPCWDEPNIKAEITLTLTFPTTCKLGEQDIELVGLSNMPTSKVERNSSSQTISFEKSPKMSAYLLAIAIGPFESIEGTDGRRPIRVYTCLGKKEHGQFALDVACKSLQYFEDYFDIKYPLPKMDLIAIPDMCFNAMENWGLVTYRENCILVDPTNTSISTQQYVAIVVAHELSHQWFGNLVTMEWWTHLWLNEGFASFMQYLCVDHIFPEYDIWSQFVSDTHCRALKLDSLQNSHPIEVPIKHPSEIGEIFDAISYSKGASIIRMLYSYITDDCFRKGMKDYLTKFAYKSATTEDLWDALEAASNKPVRKMMSGWTSQMGYPWLSIDYKRDGDKVKMSVTQSRFTANGKLSPEEAKSSWIVPILATIGSAPRNELNVCLLGEKSTEIVLDNVGDNWVKLNPGTIGVYRAAYPGEIIERLLPAVVSKTLPPMDRLGLQNDYFALSQAGVVSTVDLLKVLEAYKGEDDFTVWRSIDSCLSHLSVLLSKTDYLDKFNNYGRNLLKDLFERITFQSNVVEKDSVTLTRALLINRLVSFGHQEVIRECKERFDCHFNKTTLIQANLREPIYKAIAIFGEDKHFDHLFEIIQSSQLEEEVLRAAKAIGFAKEPSRLKRVIDFVLSKEVRHQTKLATIASLGASNPPVAFKLMQDNKDYWCEKFAPGILINRLISTACSNFVTEQDAQDVANFFEANKFPGCDRTVQQILETIRLNASQLERDSAKIKAYFS